MSKKLFPIEFLEWYSGMEQSKILRAFEKWQNECEKQMPSAVSIEEYLAANEIKDTLFYKGEWVKGGLSMLVRDYQDLQEYMNQLQEGE